MEALLRNIILVSVAFSVQTVSAVDCNMDCYLDTVCCTLHDCCYDMPDVDFPDVTVTYPVLSVGAIVGIVIGSIALIVAIVAGIVCCCVASTRRRKGRVIQQGQVVYPPTQYAYPQGGNSPYPVQKQGGVPADMLQQQQPYANTNTAYPVQQQIPQQGTAVPVEMLQQQPYANTNPPYPVQN